MNPKSNSSSCISKQEDNLRSFMRLLWEQHITWTRLTIISLIFNLPDVDSVTARLLRNATDMGNSLKSYYGNQIAIKYSVLIRDHLVISADLVKSAKAGDKKAAAAAERKWYANGDEIVGFLSTINPYISKNEFKKMFYNHLALTKSEALLILQKDYKSSIAVYGKIEAGALQMADTITDGIVKQFPKLFHCRTIG
jgi:hypothetical protein